jgi:hypothetical protein
LALWCPKAPPYDTGPDCLVDALARLLPARLPGLDLRRALFRGRYTAAVARMEWAGAAVRCALRSELEALLCQAADLLAWLPSVPPCRPRKPAWRWRRSRAAREAVAAPAEAGPVALTLATGAGPAAFSLRGDGGRVRMGP